MRSKFVTYKKSRAHGQNAICVFFSLSIRLNWVERQVRREKHEGKWKRKNRSRWLNLLIIFFQRRTNKNKILLFRPFWHLSFDYFDFTAAHTRWSSSTRPDRPVAFTRNEVNLSRSPTCRAEQLMNTKKRWNATLLFWTRSPVSRLSV